jgi:hypothetical protein
MSETVHRRAYETEYRMALRMALRFGNLSHARCVARKISTEKPANK